MAGTFTQTSGSLAEPRTNHVAVLLGDGTVLVAGGFNTTFVQSSERFNPASGTFTFGSSMLVARNQATGTLLPNGLVLIAGGNSAAFLASAELFNPVLGNFVATGSMLQTRREHTATLLGNGNVLVAGGFTIDGTGNKSLSEAEIYNTSSGIFSVTGSLSATRTDHTASLLPGGKVLITGGNIPCTPTLCGTVFNAFASAEVYDPATGVFSATGSMATSRFQHTATVLSNGKVVVAGGQTPNSGATAYGPVSSIEIYDPATGTFSSGGSLLTARWSQTATLLSNGQILFAGGFGAGTTALASAELYDPVAHVSKAVSNMSTPRSLHTATLLQNGQAVIIGGANGSVILGSAEIFK